MSISGAEVQVQNMRLHGYDLEGFSQHCESFQQLHRKGRGKLGLVPYRPTLLASRVESYRLPNPIKS
jgi:hypothetical protein